MIVYINLFMSRVIRIMCAQSWAQISSALHSDELMIVRWVVDGVDNKDTDLGM